MKCHTTSWNEHNVGSSVGDSLLPCSMIDYFCLTLQKCLFMSPDIENRNVWSSVRREKSGVAK